MADALCGPSNALQNFKSHVQSDRSLQQDRFLGPRTGAQGFRTRDPRAGSLDAEFAAFENAQVNPFLEPAVSSDFRARSYVQQQLPSGPADWSSDFQNLHLSDQPLPAQQFRAHAPLIKSTNGGWQNEFMRQQNGQMSSVAKEKQVAYNQQNVASYTSPHMQYQGSYGALSSFDPQTAIMHQSNGNMHLQENNQLEGADWSQAFEDAFQDAFKEAEQQFDHKHETPQEMQRPDQVSEPLGEIQQTEQIRIGSDAIEYTETKDQTAAQDQQDANALARVAGELLHNVQHDNSSKFQNSQFLDLMRKIRDRQIEVRDNNFESTAASSGALRDETVTSAATQDQNRPDSFAFPDMNTVYSTEEGDYLDHEEPDYDQILTSHGPLPPPAPVENQISHLHPGGRLYPEQSPPLSFVSVAASPPSVPVGGISAADFDLGGVDENRSFAQRFMRDSA